MYTCLVMNIGSACYMNILGSNYIMNFILFSFILCFSFIARAKRQTEENTLSANPLRNILGLPVVQDLLQKIEKFAIAPLRHLLGISDFPPSLNPDIDARGEVHSMKRNVVVTRGFLFKLHE